MSVWQKVFIVVPLLLFVVTTLGAVWFFLNQDNNMGLRLLLLGWLLLGLGYVIFHPMLPFSKSPLDRHGMPVAELEIT